MSVALTSSSTPPATRQEPLRVMVVDDSVVIRGLISRWVGSEPDMVVAASLRTGLEAVIRSRVNPDVAVLDIEMPELEAFPRCPSCWRRSEPHRHHGVDADPPQRRDQLKALSLGAADYIPKPESTRETGAAETFHHDPIQKIRAFGAKVRRTAPSNLVAAIGAGAGPGARGGAAAAAFSAGAAAADERAFGAQAPRVLLIGSSTGGPQALMTLVADLGPLIDRFPVLITQHMPPTFTTILAEHLARSSDRPAHEAVDGEIVKAGRIYLAPGGRHMRVVRHGTDAAIALDDGPPVNFCKPAVDPMFTSAIDVWQGGILAVVLTGMGSDGMRGGKEIVGAGGSVIAQDEASSVVWGMPGAAANAGICAAILPLNQIASKVVRVFAGDRS